MKSTIAVAGAGYIGQAHIEAALLSPTVELTAIVDPSSKAQQVANKAGVPLYVSLEQLLAVSRPEGVVLATPNQFHLPHTLQCINAGLAVLLEKPITPTVNEAEKLVSAIKQKGARVLIGHHRAHSPIMAKAKEVVSSGSLGKLVAIMGSATFFKPDHYFSDAPWRREKGAGPLLLNMIHEIHNLRMLCGEISAVQAFSSHAVRNFAVEDTVAINFRFESGALGTFMLSDTAASARSWEQTSQENKAYPSYDDEDCYILTGTHGTLSVPTMRLKAYTNDDNRSWWKPFSQSVVSVVREDPIKLQMEHFGEVIRGTTQPLVSAQDGLTNLRITEAIVEAASRGCTINVNH